MRRFTRVGQCRLASRSAGGALTQRTQCSAATEPLGLTTAVTTRKGLIQGGDERELTQLPRVSLNGEYQHGRYVEVLLTGAPFAFWNLLRRESPAGS